MKSITRNLAKFLNHISSLGGRASDFVVRFIRFIISSSSTLLLDLLILTLSVEYFKLYYLIGSGIAFTISNSANYVINRNWGFRGTRTSVFYGYLKFIIIGTIGLVLTVFLMWIFVDLLGVVYFASRIIVAIIEGTLSFILHYYITFKIHNLNSEDVANFLQTD